MRGFVGNFSSAEFPHPLLPCPGRRCSQRERGNRRCGVQGTEAHHAQPQTRGRAGPDEARHPRERSEERQAEARPDNLPAAAERDSLPH